MSPEITNSESVREYYDYVKEREYLYVRYAIRTAVFFAVCEVVLLLAYVLNWI